MGEIVVRVQIINCATNLTKAVLKKENWNASICKFDFVADSLFPFVTHFMDKNL